MPKHPNQMTAGEINKELDKLDRVDSALTDEMIAQGRGNERPSEYLKKTDALSTKIRDVFDRRSQLRSEIERRYGPGAPSRLPKGFGPITRPVKNTGGWIAAKAVKVGNRLINCKAVKVTNGRIEVRQ